MRLQATKILTSGLTLRNASDYELLHAYLWTLLDDAFRWNGLPAG